AWPGVDSDLVRQVLANEVHHHFFVHVSVAYQGVSRRNQPLAGPGRRGSGGGRGLPEGDSTVEVRVRGGRAGAGSRDQRPRRDRQLFSSMSTVACLMI